jgi:hypothetical protein
VLEPLLRSRAEKLGAEIADPGGRFGVGGCRLALWGPPFKPTASRPTAH